MCFVLFSKCVRNITGVPIICVTKFKGNPNYKHASCVLDKVKFHQSRFSPSLNLCWCIGSTRMTFGEPHLLLFGNCFVKTDQFWLRYQSHNCPIYISSTFQIINIHWGKRGESLVSELKEPKNKEIRQENCSRSPTWVPSFFTMWSENTKLKLTLEHFTWELHLWYI